MKNTFLALGLLLSAALVGCGGAGGGSASHGYGPPVVMPSPAPSNNPGPSPSPSPQSVLATHTINGGPAFINSANHAVYVFSGDTQPNQSNCNASCASVWPAVAPPTSNLPAPWAQFTRSDGTMQLSYKGKPLYTFISDTQPFVASGDNVGGFHVARP